ncbi:MAG: helix-turn-helix domain-containing protein [Pseudomonadota bacterium]
MPDLSDVEIVDGRRQRSERSRRAIIEAGIALMKEGTLTPTAQQIAARAQVGLRSFFRHFEDMEALYAAVDEELRSFYEGVFIGGNRDGSLRERIGHAVELRAQAYEDIKNIMLASTCKLWQSEVVKKNYARGQRRLRGDLDEWLPELKLLRKDDREAVDAMTSFEMWHRLRFHQGLSKNSSIEIVTRLLRGLVPAE